VTCSFDISSAPRQIPWVCRVPHCGGILIARRFSSKLGTERKKLTTFSILLPMFTKREFGVKRPMWETARPDAMLSFNSFYIEERR